jgi:DNA-directed RNA polymerase subunit RPC12/RpoP
MRACGWRVSRQYRDRLRRSLLQDTCGSRAIPVGGHAIPVGAHLAAKSRPAAPIPPTRHLWKPRHTCGRHAIPVGGASRGDYVQDERYIARSTWMCGAIVSVLQNTPIVRCDYVQDERYIARSTWMCGAIVSVLQNTPIVRCDCLSVAKHRKV